MTDTNNDIQNGTHSGELNNAAESKRPHSFETHGVLAKHNKGFRWGTAIFGIICCVTAVALIGLFPFVGPLGLLAAGFLGFLGLGSLFASGAIKDNADNIYTSKKVKQAYKLGKESVKQGMVQKLIPSVEHAIRAKTDAEHDKPKIKFVEATDADYKMNELEYGRLLSRLTAEDALKYGIQNIPSYDKSIEAEALVNQIHNIKTHEKHMRERDEDRGWVTNNALTHYNASVHTR